MTLTFDEFFNFLNGTSVEYSDTSNKFQCMDLAGKWCENLGIPYESIRNGMYGYAKDAWYLADDLTRQYFELIPNGPTNKPSKGDIVVFGTAVGFAGHIAIETGGSNTQDLYTFDQNWDTAHYYHLDYSGNHIPYSRVVKHAYYNGVLGWLHPKPVDPLDKVIAEIRYACDEQTTNVSKIAKIKYLVSQV